MKTQLKTPTAPTPSRVGVARANLADLFTEAKPVKTADIVQLTPRDKGSERKFAPNREAA